MTFVFTTKAQDVAKNEKKYKFEKLSKKDLKEIERDLLYEGKDPLIQKDTLKVDKRAKITKKIPKNMFYGTRAKKSFTKKKQRRKHVYEYFYTLKTKQDPPPYISEVYWFHTKKKKIMRGKISKKDEKFAKLLHGPYEMTVNGQVTVEGLFYFGVRHGRWEWHSADSAMLLIDKKKYYKGWLKSNEISYFNAEQTQIEEVIPYDEEGVLNGTYWKFYPSGRIAIRGEYQNNVKIKVWEERFDDEKNRRKKLIQHPNRYDDEEITEPYVIIEYDEKGNIIYQHDEKKK